LAPNWEVWIRQCRTVPSIFTVGLMAGHTYQCIVLSGYRTIRSRIVEITQISSRISRRYAASNYSQHRVLSYLSQPARNLVGLIFSDVDVDDSHRQKRRQRYKDHVEAEIRA